MTHEEIIARFKRSLPGTEPRVVPCHSPLTLNPAAQYIYLDFHQRVSLPIQPTDSQIEDAARQIAALYLKTAEPKLSVDEMVAHSPRLSNFIDRCVREGYNPHGRNITLTELAE